tara:strand:+ start:5083 stop:6174 length:1092 start_codon:yes stop_codon:yes gene_type:complete
MFQILLFKILTTIFKRLKKRSITNNFSSNKISKVLVVCTGGVGDILMCTPAIRAVKETFPDSHLTALVHLRKKALLEFNTSIDDLMPIKKNLYYYTTLYKALKKKDPPDAVFLFHTNEPFVYCLTYLVYPGKLAGYRSDNPFDFLLERSIEFNKKLHVIENNLKMVSLIGAHTNNKKMDFILEKMKKDRVENFFPIHSDTRPVIGFQIGSGALGRCWPIQKYAELGNRLIKELGANIILLGSQKERCLVKKLNRLLEKPAKPAIVSLHAAGNIICKLDALVTPNTGPMHIAFALDCPSVVLSGPTNPKNFGPLETNVKHCYIHKSVKEEPYVKLSGDHSLTMNRIKTEEVFDALLGILNISGT